MCKGLQDLLKYFIQCIEQDYQRDPDSILFSAFLIFRLAFSIFQKTSPAQRGSVSVGSADTPLMKTTPTPSTPMMKTTPTPGTPRRPTLAEVQTSPLGLGTSTTLGASPTPEGAVKLPVTPVDVRGRDIIEAGTMSSSGGEPRPSQTEQSQTPQAVNTGSSVTLVTQSTSAISTSTPNNTHDAMSLSLVSGPLLLSFYTPSTPVQEQFQTPLSLPSNVPSNVPPLHRKLTFLYERMQSQASLFNSPRILDSSELEGLRQEGSFLYKGLVKALDSACQAMVLSREFWKLLFMSTVHVDRSLMGWNEQTLELYQR